MQNIPQGKLMLESSQYDNLKNYQQRVRKLLPGGVHYNFRTPWDEQTLHFNKASKSRVWDLNGSEYLDLYARFGAMIHGHNNEEYNDALKSTIDRVLSVSHCDMDAEALELISKHIPSAEMIRFGVSGTEIVQNALRLARAWTKKNHFIRFTGHYHGNADNIMGGKIHDASYIPVDYLEDIKRTDGRATNILTNQSFLLPWNDLDILAHFLDRHSDKIAAIITEPVCINGGGIMPKPGYLQGIRSLCDKHNIVLIFDEIITGVRLGLGGAQEYFKVTPDLTTLGKAIGGGGVPVAALAGKKRIMNLVADKKVIHAGTFNGYPLGIAAVKTTFEILGRDGCSALRKMNSVMDKINSVFIKKAKEHNFPLCIQGPTGCSLYHCCSRELLSIEDYSAGLSTKDIILNVCLANHGILVSTFSRLYPNISLSEDDVAWVENRVGLAICDAKDILELE